MPSLSAAAGGDDDQEPAAAAATATASDSDEDEFFDAEEEFADEDDDASAAQYGNGTQNDVAQMGDSDEDDEFFDAEEAAERRRSLVSTPSSFVSTSASGLVGNGGNGSLSRSSSMTSVGSVQFFDCEEAAPASEQLSSSIGSRSSFSRAASVRRRMTQDSSSAPQSQSADFVTGRTRGASLLRSCSSATHKRAVRSVLLEVDAAPFSITWHSFVLAPAPTGAKNEAQSKATTAGKQPPRRRVLVSHPVFDLPPFTFSMLTDTVAYLPIVPNLSSSALLDPAATAPIVVSSTSMSAHLGVVQACLSQRSYAFAMAMLSGNLSEKSVIVSQLLETKVWKRVTAKAAAASVSAASSRPSVASPSLAPNAPPQPPVSASGASSLASSLRSSPASSRGPSLSTSPRFDAAANADAADGMGQFSLDSTVSSPSMRSRAGTRSASRSFTSTMQIDFSIASLALELRRNAGDNASDRLLSFEIGGLGVTLAKEANAAVADAAQMKCAVQLDRLELFDSSAETARSGVPENFRQLLAVRASSARSTAKPSVVRYSQSAKAGMEL
jgi:hypothetical protein